MTLRKRVLVSSVSGAALLCLGAPAFAADAAGTTAQPATVGELVVVGIRQSLQQSIEQKRAASGTSPNHCNACRA